VDNFGTLGIEAGVVGRERGCHAARKLQLRVCRVRNVLSRNELEPHTEEKNCGGHNDPPLVGGLCLVQRTLTWNGLKICPSSEDFVSFNGLRPRRASRICPSSEDFVLFNRLRPQGISESAPRRRTLSRSTDFDHVGPQDLPLVRGLCLVQRTSTS
jgi:hypothetical protein